LSAVWMPAVPTVGSLPVENEYIDCHGVSKVWDRSRLVPNPHGDCAYMVSSLAVDIVLVYFNVYKL